MQSKTKFKIKDWKQVKVSLYTDKQEIERREREIIELFDHNFGKDWRFFISLYYWEGICRHHLQYTNLKTNIAFSSLVIRKRKLYWSKGMDILLAYLTNGYNKTRKEILTDNKYRLYWIDNIKEYYTKKNNGILEDLEKQPYISSKWWEEYKMDEQQKIKEYTFFKEDYLDMCLGKEPSRPSYDIEEQKMKHQDPNDISPVTSSSAS